jgi:hypothetical protein
MSLLEELGLTNQSGLMLIAPPDSVLAEAGRLSPRPSVAPSLRHAEPSQCIVWWPEPGFLTPEALSRLHWMVSIGQGVAWLVSDARDEDSVTVEDLRAALDGTSLAVHDERSLADGGTALRCTPR